MVLSVVGASVVLMWLCGFIKSKELFRTPVKGPRPSEEEEKTASDIMWIHINSSYIMCETDQPQHQIPLMVLMFKNQHPANVI